MGTIEVVILPDMTAEDQLLTDHIPREVIFGYREDPETGMLDDRETCFTCNVPYPCAAIQVYNELKQKLLEAQQRQGRYDSVLVNHLIARYNCGKGRHKDG